MNRETGISWDTGNEMRWDDLCFFAWRFWSLPAKHAAIFIV